MLYHEIFSLGVLCVSLIGNTYSISNGPASSHIEHQAPNRRFYFYNPEIISHAASALGMVVPSAFYRPMAPSLGPSLAPVHFADYGDDEEEDIEEHHEKPPLQLFTLVKPPKKSKHNKNKKKMKGHQQHKPLKQFQKFVKKCLPFKVRIIKKSDIDSNEGIFYQNIRNQLPYGYGDEYFPQPNKQELAVISLNTSNISENEARFPQVLHFLYPRYNIQQPRPKPRIVPPRKTYRFARPLHKKHNVRLFQAQRPRRPWPKVNSWRVAPAGRPVSEYPLKEPTPDAVGGSPPPSPLFNLYKDVRIPVSQAYVDQHTESPTYKVTQNYVHFPSSTPTQIQYYPEQWTKPAGDVQINPNLDIKSHGGYISKYSDPDYYRYGTYNQEQPHQEDQQQKYMQENDQESNTNINYDTISNSDYYQNFATTSEKIITVTPTTAWVPIPQLQRITQLKKENEPQGTMRNISSSENKQIHYKSGGFKNLTNVETNQESYQFGDKIIATRNCSFLRNVNSNKNNLNCLEHTENGEEVKEKPHKRVVYSRGSSKHRNKQKGTSSAKYSGKNDIENKKNQNTVNNSKARLYINEVVPANPAGQKRNVTFTKSSKYKSKARSYNQELKSESKVVTDKYPPDNFNEIFSYNTSITSSSIQAKRSNLKGLKSVVSASILVKAE